MTGDISRMPIPPEYPTRPAPRPPSKNQAITRANVPKVQAKLLAMQATSANLKTARDDRTHGKAIETIRPQVLQGDNKFHATEAKGMTAAKTKAPAMEALNNLKKPQMEITTAQQERPPPLPYRPPPALPPRPPKLSLAERQKTAEDSVKLVKNNSEFKQIAQLLKDLSGGSKKLVLKEGEKIEDIKVPDNKGIGSLFSSRSKETQKALTTILKTIKASIEAGETHFHDGKKQIPLKTLTDHLLKDPFIQNVIKNSPDNAKLMASIFQDIIRKNKGKAFLPDHLGRLIAAERSSGKAMLNYLITLSHETERYIFKNNPTVFKQLTELSKNDHDLYIKYQKRFDELANPQRWFMFEEANKFIDDLLKIVARSEMQMFKNKLKPSEELDFIVSFNVAGDEKALLKESLFDSALKEIFKTEKTYIENIEKLLQHFNDLKRAKVLNDKEYGAVTAGWQAMINEGKDLLKKFEILEGNADPATKLKALYEAYKSDEFTRYAEAYLIVVPNHNITTAILQKAYEKREGNELFESFRKDPSNDHLDPISFLILPVQRFPRHEILLKSIIDRLPPKAKAEAEGQKKALTSEKAQDAMQQEFDYVKAYGKLVNISFPG